MTMMNDEEAGVVRQAEELQRRSGRVCGDCSICCYLLPVDEPELTKPAHTWCTHCRPGKGGCSIHDRRPTTCRKFVCLWLTDRRLGDEFYPRKSRIVAYYTKDKATGTPRLLFYVDRRVPDRWRQEPYLAMIRRYALAGLRGDAGIRFYTEVSVGEDRFLILPHREIKNRPPGVVVPVGENEFEFVATKSDADGIFAIGS